MLTPTRRRTRPPSGPAGGGPRPRRRRPQRPVTLLDYLYRAAAEINPALLLGWELQQREQAGTLDLAALITLQDRLTAAAIAGEEAARDGDQIIQALTGNPTRSQPDQLVPEGF